MTKTQMTQQVSPAAEKAANPNNSKNRIIIRCNYGAFVPSSI